MEKEIKVTGERDFGTGAQRDPNEDKGRFDLLSPLALTRLAKHTQKGAAIRGERNWENGMPIPATLDSAIRHIYCYITNKLMGQQQDEDHLAAAMWNVMNAMHFDELISMDCADPELGNFLGDLKEPYNKHAEPEQHYPWSLIHLNADMPSPVCKCCSTCFFADADGGPISEEKNPHGQCQACTRASMWSPKEEPNIKRLVPRFTNDPETD
jgi:hypothetical protein